MENAERYLAKRNERVSVVERLKEGPMGVS
jgi:hypothetical protein